MSTMRRLRSAESKRTLLLGRALVQLSLVERPPANEFGVGALTGEEVEVRVESSDGEVSGREGGGERVVLAKDAPVQIVHRPSSERTK
jgi:hypothetical protein